MKKTRILAALLCVMMVITCLPVATLAAPTAAEMDAAGEFLGAASITPTANALANAGGVLDFANSGANLSVTATSMVDAEYTADGLVLNEGDWRYSGAARWTVFNFGSYVYMKVKAAEEGTLTGSIYLCAATHAKAVFKLTKDAITFHDKDGTMTNLAEITPGTGWIEIILQRDPSVSASYSNGAQNWFVKGGSLTNWTKIATTGIDKWLDSSNNVGVNFSGSGTVNYCAVVEPSATKQDTSGSGGGESGGDTPGGETETNAPGVTAELRSAIGSVLGAAYADPATSSSDWAAMNLEFTGTFDSTQDGMNTGTGITYDSKMGATFPATDAILKYRPTCKHNGWSPLCISNNYTFGFKLKEGGTLNQQSPKIWNNMRIFMDITTSGVTIFDGGADGASSGVVTKLVDFVPGTDWVDVMVTPNSPDGYVVYMKKATDANFTKVAATTSYRSGGGAWGSTGFYVTAKNAYVSYAVSWVGADAPAGGGGTGGDTPGGDNTGSEGSGTTPTAEEFDAAGAALGKASILPAEGLAFDFVGAGTSYEQPAGVEIATNLTYKEAGMTFGAEQGNWKYNPSTKWCPFSHGSVIYFKAKVNEGGNVIMQAYWPEADHWRAYLQIESESVAIHGASGVTVHKEDFKPGTGYVEYMFYKDNRDQVIYAKGGNVSEWTKLYTATTWRNSGYNGGFNFTATNAVIPYAAIAAPSNVAQSGGGGNTPSTPSGEAYDGTQGKIADVLGSDAVIITDLQFSTDFDKQMAGVTSPADSLFDDGKGMMLGEGKQFQYLPASGYTPLAYKGMTAGVKVGAGDAVVIQVKHPNNNTLRTYVQIETGKVWVCQGDGQGGFAGAANLVDYVPGSDWNDYLITMNENQGYDVYAKPQAEEDWTLVCSTTSFRPGGGAGMGIQLYSSKGSSWIKYASVYGTQDQLPEPEGPEAGTKMTIEDIIGGIAVAKEELVFDANFNGIEANAQLKNVQSGEVAEEQPTVGANGLELVQTAGKYFAWNSGTENSWKPLTKENPVMFRAKLDAGSMLDVQLNANPRASIYLYPEKLIVQGTSQTQAKDFAPGTGWVNYLVTRDSSNFMVWTKLDGETEWTLRVTSNGFRTAGFYGVLFANTTANKVTLSEVKQYKIERMVLTDPNAIATMTNRVYIDEDFSEDTGIHNMITGKIEDGVFKRDPDAEPHTSYPNSSRLDVDLSQVNPKGQWFVRFKYRIPTAESVMSCDMVNNGNKIAIDCHDDSVFIINRTAGVGKSDTLAAAGVGNWAELLFSWTDNAYVDVYWHKVGDDEWIKTHTKFVPGSEANDKLAFHCSLAGEVDDVKVYSGDYLRVDEPVLESGLVKTSGEYFTGTLESRYDRRATLITAVYDETYGYTKFVKAKDYEVLSGRGANLTNTFVTENVDETKDTAAVMLWDTLETGIPLGDMAGVALKNNATGAPKKDAQVGVKAEANYNDVRVTGYTGIRNGRVTISVVDEGGNLRAVGQTTSSGTGLVDVSVAVDPSCPSGTYTVRVQYGSAEAVTTDIELFCDDIPYNTITDVNSMSSFIDSYGSETAKKWNEEETFASDVYARFLDAKGSATTFATLYDFRDVMDVATNGEVHERQFCLDVNTAAKNGKWSDVQDLVMDGTLGVTVESMAGISDKKALFMRMTGGYSSEADVLAAFQSALAAQKTAESNTGAGFGGAAGGGAAGGGSVGSGIFQGTTGFENTGGGGAAGGGSFGGQAPVTLPEDFSDLGDVDWAKDSIKALRNMGVISGNGDGTFAPNREVTREEFLKMALQAAGIKGNGNVDMAFTDVDANAWYYPYIAIAYEAGIVNGMSETTFGIGEKITRADMAVMLKRIMDYKNIGIEKKVAAYVFDDFDTIPDYARASVTALAQAQLMNGKGDNNFEGNASATRAESAVAIYRIYNYMVEGR